MLERVGGTLGAVEAHMEIEYSADPNITDMVKLNGTPEFSATFGSGEAKVAIHLNLIPTAFLKIGASFTITLTNATLVGEFCWELECNVIRFEERIKISYHNSLKL